jgi:2-dehydro-3-deoxyglucarate aldolase
MIDLKHALRDNLLTIGSWISVGNENTTEIMAMADFDWLVIDMEHSAFSIETAQRLIRVIESSDCIPLVRVGDNDSVIIKRVMDAGSHGVIVPMVNTADEARQAVRSVYYPPRGERGVGLARAQQFGEDFEGYKDWLQTEAIVIAQIEHIKAVENLEEILTVEGIDGFIVGPYDLSGSLGVPGELDHPLVREALEEIDRVAKKLHKSKGFHVVAPNTEEFTAKIADGFTFLAASVDMLLLSESCSRFLQSIKTEEF